VLYCFFFVCFVAIDFVPFFFQTLRDTESSKLTVLLCCVLGSNNMMYPRENRAERKLEYHCKNCNQVEDARSTLVFTNNITTKNEYILSL
jgi:hypothetical protein